MITRNLRHAVIRAAAAAGHQQANDPGLRPTGIPGQYAASVALTLGGNPRATAETLAGTLAREQWIDIADVTGPGYLTITVTPAALAAVADSITAAGPACATSDALAGVTVPAAPPGDPLTASTWEKARTALAAQLTARLAAAAGATIAEWSYPERSGLPLPLDVPLPSPVSRHIKKSDDLTGVGRPRSGDSSTGSGVEPHPRETEVARAISFAGRDAVTFTLARAIPGRPLRIEPEIIARRVVGNPAYAVRYAHARAASGVRWAVTSRGGDRGVSPREATALPCPPADLGELALLDALSWLPERVATAARRDRPDEFARYLEDLANVTVDVLSSVSHPGSAPIGNRAPGSDRLSLARAARTGLAAGLGLLEISAPDRL